MSATGALLPPRSNLARVLGTPGAAAGVAVLILLVLGAIFAPMIAPFDPVATRVCPRLAPPSGANLFAATTRTATAMPLCTMVSSPVE